MIILKTLLTGGNTAQQPIQISSVKGDSGRDGTRRDAFNTEDKRIHERARKMEFMYCIPDLEVFIDKTIKKCLLEYDLDANDTEAVLDDMEKAWPKSPVRSSEKQVLRDCNDNSQRGRSNRQDHVTNQFPESTLLGGALGKDVLKGGDTVVHFGNGSEKDSRELTEKLPSKREDRLDAAVPNGKKERDHAVFEGDRSDTSSPDVIDGQSQARKHPKLKSILQQRYFGGQESFNCDKGQPQKKAEEKLDETWGSNKQMASNLDLLASAADIHTVSARGTDEHRIQAIRRLQEESERRFQISAAKRFPQNSFHESAAKSADASGRMPVLLKLISSPSSSSSPMHEFNNHDSDAISGHHISSLRTVSPETGQRSPPSRATNEDPHLMAISRPQVKNSTSFLTRDKAQQMFQAHQNGYHAHTPQETVVVRRDVSVISNEGNIKSNQMSSLVARASLLRDNNIDLTPSATHYNNFNTTARSQILQQKQLDHHHNYSESFFEPLHYHGSRIASIIAEELQKDDDRDHEPRTHLSVSRTEIKPSDINEPTRIRSFSLPGTYKRATSIKSANYQSPVSSVHIPMNANYKSASPNEHVTSAQSQTVFQILPAHFAMTNTHSGSTILSSHLGHTTSIGSSAKVGNSCLRDDEDQPQDLSTKSRGIVEVKHEGHYPFSSTQATPATVSETRKYFSTPISQFTQNRIHHTESTSCCHSDPECDIESKSDNGSWQIKTKELEQKGQVQGLNIYTEEVKASKILAKSRRPKTRDVTSVTRDTETKRRKL